MRGWKQDMVKASLNAIRSEPVVQWGELEWSWFTKAEAKPAAAGKQVKSPRGRSRDN